MESALATLDTVVGSPPNPPGCCSAATATDGRFEGPEKILEVDFVPTVGKPSGLRGIAREAWDKVLADARCLILSHVSNEFMDAYVLSESSLFVYTHKCFLKTCGTTTLLRCLPALLEMIRAEGLELEWLGYSRKDFTFPKDQVFPHTSFTQEVRYADSCVGPHGKPLVGGAYVLGDLRADHWFVYVADYCERAMEDSTDCNINVMMYGLAPEVQALFQRSRYEDMTLRDAALETRRASGINRLVDDALVDDCIFEPCGYSMNALHGEYFSTVHVTPEDAFSYASFETNMRSKSYESLLSRVLGVFRPLRFAVTVFADQAAFETMDDLPALVSSRGCCGGEATELLKFRRVSRSTTCFKTDYVCLLANYAPSSGSESG